MCINLCAAINELLIMATVSSNRPVSLAKEGNQSRSLRSRVAGVQIVEIVKRESSNENRKLMPFLEPPIRSF